MDWARILAYVTGTVDQELLARIEYLAAENRILKAQLKGRLKLSDAERAALGEIGHRLGRKPALPAHEFARPWQASLGGCAGTRHPSPLHSVVQTSNEERRGGSLLDQARR